MSGPAPLHPDFQRFVDDIARAQAAGAPSWDQLTAQELRAATKDIRKSAAPVPGVARRDVAVAGARGPLDARLYTPDGSDETGPGLVYFHGGGFAIGSIDTHDSIVAKLALASGVRMLSVEYGLGPEQRFPAAHDDALASSRWAFDNAAQIGFDRARIGIGGDSAGANLAAATCLSLRGDANRRVRFQLLAYPNTTILGSAGSRAVYAHGYYLTLAAAHHLLQFYVDEQMATDPRIDLLHRDDLAGLPPTLLAVAQCDILYDEGLAFGHKLQSAGVPLELLTFPGFIHGFLGFAEQVPDVDKAFAAIGQAVAVGLDAPRIAPAG
jgi:acetyl esterase